MNFKCPKCDSLRPNISKNGFFRRKSDSKNIQKYRCKNCNKQFSLATFSPCYQQNKRRLNHPIRIALCSSMSIRRIALAHNISRTTVKRKLEFLASQAKIKQEKWLSNKVFNYVEFDDLESFEHTKCKPLSVTVAVESKTRKIIGFQTSSIGAKGHLAQIALTKYGKRKNDSYKSRRIFFRKFTKKYFRKSSL